MNPKLQHCLQEYKFAMYNNDEQIITHNAFDRKIFAKGAIKAIEWIVNQKPGLYSMQEIIF